MMGLRIKSTCFIIFDNVKVPVENLVGEIGKGFYYIMENLNHERLVGSS